MKAYRLSILRLKQALQYYSKYSKSRGPRCTKKFITWVFFMSRSHVSLTLSRTISAHQRPPIDSEKKNRRWSQYLLRRAGEGGRGAGWICWLVPLRELNSKRSRFVTVCFRVLIHKSDKKYSSVNLELKWFRVSHTIEIPVALTGLVSHC